MGNAIESFPDVEKKLSTPHVHCSVEKANHVSRREVQMMLIFLVETPTVGLIKASSYRDARIVHSAHVTQSLCLR